MGEGGPTLSDVQKERVTLARAVYSQARVLMSDGVLAALDVHTAKWIADKRLRDDFVRGRTVLLAVSIDTFVRYSSANVAQDPRHCLGGIRCRLCRFPRTGRSGLESRNSLGDPQVQQTPYRRGQD